MTEAHWGLIFMIIFILWGMGLISILPNSKRKASKHLAKTIYKRVKKEERLYDFYHTSEDSKEDLKRMLGVK
jgi:hypothetical protein